MRNQKNIILNMYFIDGLRPVDIAKKINVSKSAISQILSKDERYLVEKEKRKTMNRKRHIENTKEYIKSKRQFIQFEHKVDDLVLRNIHNKDMSELSKPRKLSNLAYMTWNISAFKFNKEKNRFEFREELGRSADVPKYIKVEVL